MYLEYSYIASGKKETRLLNLFNLYKKKGVVLNEDCVKHSKKDNEMSSSSRSRIHSETTLLFKEGSLIFFLCIGLGTSKRTNILRC